MTTVTFAAEIYMPRFHELGVEEGGRLSLSEGISAVYKEVEESKKEGLYDVHIEVAAPDHVKVADLSRLVQKTFGSENPKTKLRVVNVDDGS